MQQTQVRRKNIPLEFATTYKYSFKGIKKFQGPRVQTTSIGSKESKDFKALESKWRFKTYTSNLDIGNDNNCKFKLEKNIGWQGDHYLPKL